MRIGRHVVENEVHGLASASSKRLMRAPSRLVGMAFIATLGLVALFADRIAPADPFDTTGPALSSPSGRHPMGTDNLGRDLATGIVHGTRTSLTVVIAVVAISAVVGITVGAVAGLRGGVLDLLLMRIGELVQVVPRFFLALLVIASFGPGIDRLIVLLGLTSWPLLARVVRIEVLALKQREFVAAAVATGASGPRVLVAHIVPNVLPVAVVLLTLLASRIILIEAGLAFLGLGDQDRVSWGALANNAQNFLQLAWWMALFPGLAIALAVFGLNLLGGSVNEALEHGRS